MTPLRQGKIQNMQLRGSSARTQECHVAAVRQIAPKNANSLAPEGAPAIIFRAKLCAALNRAGWLPQVGRAT